MYIHSSPIITVESSVKKSQRRVKTGFPVKVPETYSFFLVNMGIQNLLFFAQSNWTLLINKNSDHTKFCTIPTTILSTSGKSSFFFVTVHGVILSCQPIEWGQFGGKWNRGYITTEENRRWLKSQGGRIFQCIVYLGSTMETGHTSLVLNCPTMTIGQKGARTGGVRTGLTEG